MWSTLPLRNSSEQKLTHIGLGRPLDMEMTLEENEIKDESRELDLDQESYIPVIHLYYNTTMI